MADYNKAVFITLQHEGVLSNDSDDSGGLTKYGISQKAYPKLDIKNLTLEQAKQIYFSDYWMPLRLDTIKSQEIANTIFDCAVNCGVITAAKMAQKIFVEYFGYYNFAVDGLLGVKSQAALNTIDSKVFIKLYAFERTRYYLNIVKRNPSQFKFLKSWLTRI